MARSRVYSRSCRYEADGTWVQLVVAVEVSFILGLFSFNEAVTLLDAIIQLQGKSFNMKYQRLKLFLSVSFTSSIWNTEHGRCALLNNEPEKFCYKSFIEVLLF